MLYNNGDPTRRVEITGKITRRSSGVWAVLRMPWDSARRGMIVEELRDSAVSCMI
jgi:hypothetical protein